MNNLIWKKNYINITGSEGTSTEGLSWSGGYPRRASFPHDPDPSTSPLSWINEVWVSWTLRSHPLFTLRACERCEQIRPFESQCPCWLIGKEPTCQCRRLGFSSWFGKMPWSRKCNPLQYSFLGDPMDRGDCQATVHGVSKESDTT